MFDGVRRWTVAFSVVSSIRRELAARSGLEYNSIIRIETNLASKLLKLLREEQ